MREKGVIAAAVSGGVDSLYALAALKAAGERVIALYGRFRDSAEDPVPALTENCRRLGVNLYVADLRSEFFRLVARPFAESYAAGLTPNPCALCNVRIKFGLLFDYAAGLGAACLATGHYVRRLTHPVYGEVIGMALDMSKDQSYFLSLVPPERLHRAVFPLAGITKDEARRAVSDFGLTVPLPKESQEICFVPGNDYRALISTMKISLSGPGPVKLVGPKPAVIGQHAGLWRYTEGQRHGLGIAWSEPLFVVGKNLAHNTLLVGTAEAQRKEGCVAVHANLHVPPALWPESLRVRIRYRQKAVPACVLVKETSEGTALVIQFSEPQNVAAPGQTAAVYDTSGVLLGGGIIANPEPADLMG